MTKLAQLRPFQRCSITTRARQVRSGAFCLRFTLKLLVLFMALACASCRDITGDWCSVSHMRSTGCSSGAPASPPSGGGTVLDRTDSDVKFDTIKKPVKGPMYKVLLHNDNMNKREYVVKVLLKVVEEMTVDKAVNIMQEAHMQGLALVTIAAQEVAEQYVAGLRRNGLTSTLEPDDSGSRD